MKKEHFIVFSLFSLLTVNIADFWMRYLDEVSGLCSHACLLRALVSY